MGKQFATSPSFVFWSSLGLMMTSPLAYMQAAEAQTIDTSRPYFTQSDSVAHSSVISFTGGTLRLTENFTSPTFINIGSAGGTIDTNGFDGNFTGRIFGTGTFNKTGLGNLYVFGANASTGTFNVTGGGLIGDSRSLNTNISLQNGTSTHSFVVMADTIDFTYANTVSGNGDLHQSGSNRLTLSGTNTYTGSTYISRGTLAVSGDNRISSASPLVFSYSYSPSSDGSAPTIYYGTFDLNGYAQTFSELSESPVATVLGTTVNPNGTVAINGGALTINQSANRTFSGAITGTSGSFTKSGSGQLTLAGTSSFTGTTTVNGGALRVDGSLPSAITVASGGALRGTGRVGAVDNNGLVQVSDIIGNPMGTLNVSGNFTQRSNGTLSMRIANTGASDKLVVGGTAYLAGTLAVVPQPGIYQPGTRYGLVSAGQVQGNFSSVTSTMQGLTLNLNYTNTGVELVLDAPGSGPEIDVSAIIAREAAQSVTDTGQAQSRTATRSVVSAVSNRLQTVFSGRQGNTTRNAAGSGRGLSAGDATGGTSVWSDVSASRIINSVTADSFSGWSQNLLFGADHMVADGLVAGGVLSIENSRLDTTMFNGSRRAYGAMATAYAGYLIDEHFNVNAQFGVGGISNRVKQTLGTLADDNTFPSVRVMSAINLNSEWQADRFELSTLTGLSYAYDKFASYENAAGSRVEPGPSRLAQVRIGGEVAYVIDQVRPYLSATYEGDIGSNGPGDRHGAILGGGMRMTVDDNLTAGVLGTAQVLRRNDNVYSAYANVRYSF